MEPSAILCANICVSLKSATNFVSSISFFNNSNKKCMMCKEDIFNTFYIWLSGYVKVYFVYIPIIVMLNKVMYN